MNGEQCINDTYTHTYDRVKYETLFRGNFIFSMHIRGLYESDTIRRVLFRPNVPLTEGDWGELRFFKLSKHILFIRIRSSIQFIACVRMFFSVIIMDLRANFIRSEARISVLNERITITIIISEIWALQWFQLIHYEMNDGRQSSLMSATAQISLVHTFYALANFVGLSSVVSSERVDGKRESNRSLCYHLLLLLTWQCLFEFR